MIKYFLLALVLIATQVNAQTYPSQVGYGGNSTVFASSVSIGTTSTGSVLNVVGLTTGTNADFLCLGANGTVLIQTSACTISRRDLKENFIAVKDNWAVTDLMALKPEQFNFRPTNPKNRDPNAIAPQYGFIADEVASVDPKLSVYEDDMITPKSYRQEAIISILVKGFQAHEKRLNGSVAAAHACFFNLLLCPG